MASGAIKWFSAAKSLGYNWSATVGEDAFVHISAVERAGLCELREGQRAGFDIERDARGGKSAAGLRVVG